MLSVLVSRVGFVHAEKHGQAVARMSLRKNVRLLDFIRMKVKEFNRSGAKTQRFARGILLGSSTAEKSVRFPVLDAERFSKSRRFWGRREHGQAVARMILLGCLPIGCHSMRVKVKGSNRRGAKTQSSPSDIYSRLEVHKKVSDKALIGTPLGVAWCWPL